MISLAILGLMQALFIPGFLISIVISKYSKLPLVDNLLIATPMSIVLNYLLVSILVLMHVYTQLVMLLVVGVELVVLLYVLMRNSSQNIPLVGADVNEGKDLWPTNRYLQIFFNVVAIGLLITLYRPTAGSVFEQWDAVVSWNRWAKEWFNQSPGGTWGYPPGLPILYSLVYKFADTTNLQTIAKLVASFFPVYGLLCFWRIGYQHKTLGLASSIAGVLFIYLQTVSEQVGFIFAGYTDPIMASLGVFTLYALFTFEESAKSGLEKSESKYTVALISVAMSSIAMIKQSGVLVDALFAMLTIYAFRQTIIKEKKYWAVLALIFGSLVTAYYIFSLFYWNDYASASSTIKGSVLLRPYTGFQHLLAATGKWIWLLALISIFMDQLSRRIFLILIVPLYLFWAYLVSYDLRTAYVFFPWLAMVAGIALAKIEINGKPKLLIFSLISYLFLDEVYSLHPDIVNPVWLLRDSARIGLLYFVGMFLLKTFTDKYKVFSAKRGALFVISAIVLGLAVLPYYKNSEILLAENTFKRIQSNDLGLNQKISNLFEQEPNSKLISCLQMFYNIPSSEGRFIPAGGCFVGLADVWMSRPDIKYYLQYSLQDKESLQQTRDRLVSKDFKFTEEKLGEGYTLFVK